MAPPSDRPDCKDRAADRRPFWDVLFLVSAAAVLLGVALTLETVTFARLGKSPEVYSIPGGVRSLWDDGTTGLAAIVFLFSVAYPTLKLVLLAWLAWRPRLDRKRARLLTILRHLGRASFLDVFLIGLFVTSIQGPLAKAESHSGIAFFLAAVLLSMVAAVRLATKLAESPRSLPRTSSALCSPTARLVSFASAGLFLACCLQTILTVKIGPFFEHEVELVGGFELLLKEQDRLLGIAGFLFVFAAPAGRVLLGLAVRLRPTEGAVRWLLRVDEWAMLEVYGLALFILRAKLEQLASVDLAAGYGLVLAAGVTGHVDALWVRLSLRTD